MKLRHLINRERLINAFIELININSPSFHEQEIGKVLTKKLKEAGCRVIIQRYDRSFNIIARKNGKNSIKPLMLSAHMDTIEPTTGIAYAVTSRMVRSTGATVLGADDKSALSQILEVLAVIKERNIDHGTLEIVFTSAEEKGIYGARNLDYSLLESRHALVLDSGGPVGRIVIAAPTHYTYEMKVSGRSAHAGIEPEKGISSIRCASEIISALPDGRINASTTANVGIISGGTATNVVPQETRIHGEFRSHQPATLARLKKTVNATAQTIAKRHCAAVSISWQEEYRSFQIPSKDPFLKYVGKVHAENGISPNYVRTGGGSDANIFNQKGITAINISNGMQKVHSREEYILVKDLLSGCGVVLGAVAGMERIS